MIRILIFSIVLFSQPLFSETLNLEIVNEAIAHAHAYWRLNDEGKTVKAKKEMARAEAILKAHIKPNKKMTFPAGCSFRYKQGPLDPELDVSCPGYERINFVLNTDDKLILERLQDCTEGCTGEFYFLREKYNINRLMFNCWHGDTDSIDLGLYVKFTSVKQLPKVKEETGNTATPPVPTPR